MKTDEKKLPISWLMTEILSVVLIVLCLFHAMQQEDMVFKVFELLCFIFGAAVFEHVGVLISKTYTYDQHRLLRAGLLPLSILLIEAAIVYIAMILFEYLHMPAWTSIWVVGLFCVFFDFAIDPVYVYDRYLFDGKPSGQWNWVIKYEGGYFGIPYQNFTGWIYMCGYYAGLIYLFEFLSEKFGVEWLHIVNPFLSGILLIVPIMITGPYLIDGKNKKVPELVKLLAGCILPVILLIIFYKNFQPVNWQKDWILIAVPVLIHAYNIITMFVRKISRAYIPVTICAIINILCFAVL